MMGDRYEGRAADHRVHALRLAQELVALCSDCSVTVATAESCTAGMVASTIGGVPGASDVLRGGAVTCTYNKTGRGGCPFRFSILFCVCACGQSLLSWRSS